MAERWAYVLGKTPPIRKPVPIRARSFDMGEKGETHRVTFSRPFDLGATEVTFREWDACVADGACNAYHPADQGWGRGDQPVVNVSWEEAKAYAAWLSRRTGRECRLPTEAEWEHACRAGTEKEFALPKETGGSDDIAGRGLANCKGCGSQWDGRRTAPVAQFPTNAWGLHDMHGNVWEWVEDCWHGSYEDEPEDGRAWLDNAGGDCASRVARGGSWDSDQDSARCTFRLRLGPIYRYPSVGFRVLCSSPVEGD